MRNEEWRMVSEREKDVGFYNDESHVTMDD